MLGDAEMIAAIRPMTSPAPLGSALEAFIREHEYCGELDTGLDDDRAWMTCTCGAMINRDANHDGSARPTSRGGARVRRVLDALVRPCASRAPGLARLVVRHRARHRRYGAPGL